MFYNIITFSTPLTLLFLSVLTSHVNSLYVTFAGSKVQTVRLPVTNVSFTLTDKVS